MRFGRSRHRLSLLVSVCLVAATMPAPATQAPPPSVVAPDDPAAQEFARAVAAYRSGDPGQAARLFARLARANDAEAQYNMALLYLQGEGVPQNLRQALYWAWRARLTGLGKAVRLIGVIDARIATGATPKMKDALARDLLDAIAPRVAAGDGHAMLAKAVVLAEVMPKPDLQEVYVWQAIAAALATRGAARERDRTLARLPLEKRIEVQALAEARFGDWCNESHHASAACDLAQLPPEADAAIGPPEAAADDTPEP